MLTQQSVTQHLIDCDADPQITDRWTVETHQKSGKFTWDPSKVQLYLSVNQQNGDRIEGNELRKEVAQKPALNANVLDYLLANPHLIPEDWKGKAVFFWGTIYRDSDGGLWVKCLCWGDSCWRWRYGWLDVSWGDRSPAATVAS